MKKVLLPIILLISLFNAKAQDKLCNDITKSVENSTVIYTAPTPGWPFMKTVMEFTLFKVIKAGGSQMYLRIAGDSPNPNETSTDVSVKFEDNSLLGFSNVVFKHVEPTIVVRGTQMYLYTTTVPLSDADVQKLKTKKVTRYTVVDHTGAATPMTNFKDRIMAYANCLDAQQANPAEIDPRNLMTKNFDDMKNITTYSSPANDWIVVAKTISGSDNNTSLIFHLYKEGAGDPNQTVYVKFDDGSVLNFPGLCKSERENHDNYFYTCSILLKNDNIKSFKDKKIVKFQIADKDMYVDNTLGLSVNTWVNQLEGLK